jgi:hypothetical protein
MCLRQSGECGGVRGSLSGLLYREMAVLVFANVYGALGAKEEILGELLPGD